MGSSGMELGLNFKLELESTIDRKPCFLVNLNLLIRELSTTKVATLSNVVSQIDPYIAYTQFGNICSLVSHPVVKSCYSTIYFLTTE